MKFGVHGVVGRVAGEGSVAHRAAKAMAQLAGFKACFAADTPMRTPSGHVMCQDVRVDDLLLSRDEWNPSGLVVAQRVEEVFVREGLILELKVLGRSIRTTAEHPFHRYEDGWVACNRLQVGDRIALEDGWAEVEGLVDTGSWETVYNFRIAEFHTYFVGCDEWGFSVWAHNAYKPDPADVAAYKAQRAAGQTPDWSTINPSLTVRQQSAVRAAARAEGTVIPTPNPFGKRGDPVSKRTGTYAARELDEQGFSVIEREARFHTPGSPTGKAHRDVDVLAINPQTKEAVIVQVVRTTDRAKLTPHPREFDAMSDIMASPRYQDLVNQGYTVTPQMVRRGATGIGSPLRTF